MKIYKSNERFSYDLTSKKEWIPFVTFNSLYQMGIIDSYKQIRFANHKALKLLKTFNDNIIAVNIKTESYKVRTKDKVVTLPFTRLSHGERLFMICLMADSTGKDICVR